MNIMPAAMRWPGCSGGPAAAAPADGHNERQAGGRDLGLHREFDELPGVVPERPRPRRRTRDAHAAPAVLDVGEVLGPSSRAGARRSRGARRASAGRRESAPAIQRVLGIDDVVLGHLTSATTLLPGATHALAGGTRVGMEAEVALHIGTELPGGATPDAARAAVAGLGAAIELVDLDRSFDDLEAIVAGNVFHRAVTFGTASPPP